MRIDKNLTADATLMEIARRVKQTRILTPMTQEELAAKSFVSLPTIRRFEAGHDVGFLKALAILKALDLESSIDALVPDQSERPSLYVSGYRGRKRASKRNKPNENWKWGDEK